MQTPVILKDVRRSIAARTALFGSVAMLAVNTSAQMEARDSSSNSKPSPVSRRIEPTPQLQTLRMPTNKELFFGISAAACLAGGTYATMRSKNRHQLAKNIAHPFSWFGWALDSAIATITLASTQSWGMTIIRTAAVVANGIGLVLATGGQGRAGKNTFEAFREFARKKEERWNIACLGVSMVASVIVGATKFFGEEVKGARYHTIATLGLLGFVFTSVPTLRLLAKDLRKVLPETQRGLFLRFCKESPASIAWSGASIISLPLAWSEKMSWATIAWVVFPLILNPLLLLKAWRGYVRDSDKTPPSS